MNCRTLGEAVEKYCKYEKIVDETTITDVKKEGGVAEKLSMSVRNLQIYLKREGASYTKLLNEIRKDRAVNYLKDKSISIDETAYILGFSETSAFYRAFKKWTGFTPGEFRTAEASELPVHRR